MPAASDDTPIPLQVGFIGLGNQGGPMAERIVGAGFRLSVWARRAASMVRFEALGATATSSAAELGARCDLVALCVTAEEDVREILFDHGLLDSLRPGSILVNHSTVSAQFNVELARTATARDLWFLEAPVSGSGAAALRGNLLVLVAGDKLAANRARPVFDSFGGPVIAFEAVGEATVAKLINNMLMIAHLGLADEALRIGANHGLDPAVLRSAIMAGTGNSFSMGTLGRIQGMDYAGHVNRLLQKDAGLIVDALPDARDGFGPLLERTLGLLTQLADGKSAVMAPENMPAGGAKQSLKASRIANIRADEQTRR